MSNSKILIGAVIALVFFGGCNYNGMVKKSNVVDQEWADVESNYQLRSNLIPNLAKIVQNAANFEKETLTAVIKARQNVSNVNISSDNLTPENIAKYQSAQNQLGSSLSKLMLVVERYPDLKAVQGYRDFQAQYQGIENRIAVATQDFNEAATKYNTSIESFPNTIWSGMMGFEKKPVFKSTQGAEVAPDVNDYMD